MADPSSIRCDMRGPEGEGIQRENKTCNKINSSNQDELADTDIKSVNGESNSRGDKEIGKQTKKTRFFNGKNSRKFKDDNWPVEPTVCGMVNGISNELDGYKGRLTNKSYKRVDKLKCLGNSIVPQIAELLFRQINPLTDIDI